MDGEARKRAENPKQREKRRSRAGDQALGAESVEGGVRKE